MRFKKGDRVKIISVEDMLTLKNILSGVPPLSRSEYWTGITPEMLKFCGTSATIKTVINGSKLMKIFVPYEAICYELEEDSEGFWWSENMLEPYVHNIQNKVGIIKTW